MVIQEDLINKEVLSHLINLYQKNRLAHAYLFIGSESAGKTQTALALAKTLNCEKFLSKETAQFCDQCPSCMKINSGNHPDIHVTDSAYGETIKIEQIRQILEQIRLRPFMAQKKFFILRRSENLTAEAANAFLKTLEEPSINSLLILTTSQTDKNLDTIRSRCHQVRFLPASRTELADTLRTYYHRDALSAQSLSLFAHGYLGEAKRLQENKFFERKNELLDGFIFSRDIDNFMKEILAEKNQTKEFLDIIASWVADAVLIKIDEEESRIFHIDRLADLKKFSQKYSFQQLNDIYDEITNMYKQLAENLNLKLPLLLIKEKL